MTSTWGFHTLQLGYQQVYGCHTLQLGVPTSLQMLTDLPQPWTSIFPLWNSKTNITSERITHWSPFTSSCNPVLQAQSSSFLGDEASTVNTSPSAPSPHTFTAVSACLLTYCVLAPSCSREQVSRGRGFNTASLSLGMHLRRGLCVDAKAHRYKDPGAARQNTPPPWAGYQRLQKASGR